MNFRIRRIIYWSFQAAGEEDDGDRSPSIISEISSELKDYAQTASNTLSELLGEFYVNPYSFVDF